MDKARIPGGRSALQEYLYVAVRCSTNDVYPEAFLSRKLARTHAMAQNWRARAAHIDIMEVKSFPPAFQQFTVPVFTGVTAMR